MLKKIALASIAALGLFGQIALADGSSAPSQVMAPSLGSGTACCDGEGEGPPLAI